MRAFLSLLLCVLIIISSGCSDSEDSLGPEIVDLLVVPETVVAGGVSVITFKVVPRSDAELFAWAAFVTTTTAGGGTLDQTRGLVEPNGRVTIKFQSKDATTGDGALITVSAVDSNLAPSKNTDPAHSFRIKVIAATP